LQEITIFDGNEDGHRIIVFLSEFGSNLIENFVAHISMDGTFKKIISISFANSVTIYRLRLHP